MNAPLDSRPLRTFRALARTDGFTQAARELHFIQSGVSHSLKAREHHLGCRLLGRLSEKVGLTFAMVGTLRLRRPACVQPAERREPTIIKGSRCAAERGVDSASALSLPSPPIDEIQPVRNSP